MGIFLGKANSSDTKLKCSTDYKSPRFASQTSNHEQLTSEYRDELYRNQQAIKS